MPITTDKIFTTATALGGAASGVREFAPCDGLKPFIRCFWEADGTLSNAALRIIPDCCADILIYVSENRLCSHFCGVSNKSFISHGGVKTFGIRFYAWSVCLFTRASMNGTLNGYLPADAYFRNFGAVAAEIEQAPDLPGRIAVAQKYLWNELQSQTENSDVMNGLDLIILRQARVNVAALSEYCAVSKRALERKFRAQTGLSPKETIELIRYQLLWQQCLQPDFNILDSVEEFGFYDAAHLYNDFKKFHGISLPHAVKTR